MPLVGLSVAWPNSNTIRYSSAPFTSATGGHYNGKVTSWGSLDYGISDRSGRLPSVETRVQIDDTSREIARIVSGVYADTVRGSAATIYLGAPTVASSSWDTLFVGSVVKVSFPSPFVAELTLRVADDQLQRQSPRGGWALTRTSWPNAKAEVFDQMAPVLYGIHDASNVQTGPGLIPTLYVDTVAFRYLVCAGKAKSIDRVYVGGVQTGSGWTASYVTVNGRVYTIVTFSADQGDAEITVDAHGYEPVGDASGTTITNPATQWAHRLSNFVLGDYASGSWLSTNALIDSSYLTAAESYFTNLGAKSSFYDSDRRTGHDITAQYCHSWRMRTWWTMAGKIASGYENIFALPYTGTRWRWFRDELGPFSLSEDDWQITSRILCRQAYSSSQGSYLATLEVTDPSVSSETQETLDLEWSDAG